MRIELAFNSRRSPVIGRGGMVATSQTLAAASGLDILEKGGNAADAAVATAAALSVIEPHSTGLGGDCFVLYFEAKEQKVFSLNGSGRCPASLSLERLEREGMRELPSQHPYTITVPGACAGWVDLVDRFGRLPIAKSLAPAIRMAEEGFPVAPLTAYYWDVYARQTLQYAFNGLELTIDGRGPWPGEVFRNPGLARTLRLIAEGGKEAFYQGSIAEAVISVIREAGGCMSLEDLAEHQSTWTEPIYTDYGDVRVWECPPNGQGLVTLLALNILSGFDLASLPSLSAQRIHLAIESLRLAFADAARYVADPTFAAAPLEVLLSMEYAEKRRRLIDPAKANDQVQPGIPYTAGDTVYLTVMDREGNACSLINSVYDGFGTGIVPQGFGFCLQNRGHNFQLQPGHPNALAPGKRPYHTIIPAMATYRDGSLYASFGLIGGFTQPQGQLQVMLGLVDDRMDPQAVLDRPRFCLDLRRSHGQISHAPVALEEGIPLNTMAALADMGHAVFPVTGLGRNLFGNGQIICRNAENGVLWGGSDPRGDGCAMTLCC